MKFASTLDNSSLKKGKPSTYEELGAALLQWASHVRSMGNKKIEIKLLL